VVRVGAVMLLAGIMPFLAPLCYCLYTTVSLAAHCLSLNSPTHSLPHSLTTDREVSPGFIDYHVPPPSSSSSSSSSSSADTAAATAVSSSFNAKTGAFCGAGTDSHWTQLGRQSDREGRQMSGESCVVLRCVACDVFCNAVLP
jgi:hypothetical protein